MPDREIEVAVQSLDPVAFARERLGFTADPVQARVLRAHVRRGLLNCTRQWGKSTVTAIKALHQSWFEPESLTLVVSPSARQSAEFLRKVEGFLKQLRIRVKGDGDNAISVALPNGSRIVGLPGNEDTIRGFSAVRLLLIDEAARVPDDLYRTVRPMLATSRGSLWLMSTPHGQRGFFYDEWTAGDGDEWLRIRVPATECPRIAPEVLAEERRKLGERWFRQEYLCEFTESEGYVFSRELVEAALRYDLPPLFPE